MKSDISGARAILNNEILWNNSSEEEFYKMVELCEFYSIFDKHDGVIEDKDINEYDENDLLDLNTDLTFNFSKERCLLAYKVSRYLNKKDFKSKENRSNDFSEIKNTVYGTNSKSFFNNDSKNKNGNITKNILLVGGIIVGVAVLAKILRKRK